MAAAAPPILTRRMSGPGKAETLSRTVVRGAGLAGAGHVLTQALTLTSYVVLARLISPHEFGQLAAASTVVGLGVLVSESGMLAAVVQRRDRVEEAASTAFVATVLGGILLGLCALALAPLVGLYFHSRTIGIVAASLAGYIVLRQTMVVPDALMQRNFSFVRRIVLEPIGVVAFGVVAIVGGALGHGVWALVWGTYAGVVVQVVLSWTFVRWRPRRRLVSYAMWRELASYGRHVVAAEGVRLANIEARTLMIGRFVGTSALGQYSYAFRVAGQPLAVLVNTLAYVLMPALSRISHEEARFRDAVLRSLRWMAVLSLLALMLLPLAEPLVVLVFGARWRLAGETAAALAGVSVGGALISLASETWKAAGTPEYLPRTHFVSLVLAVGIAAALLPFGLVWVAAGYSFSALLAGTYALRGVGKVIGARWVDLLRQLWAPVLAAGGMLLVLYPLEGLVDAGSRGVAVGLLLLAAEALVGLAVYAGLLGLIWPAVVAQAVRTLRARLRRGSQAPLDAEPVTPASAP